jgi:hypothetical protein
VAFRIRFILSFWVFRICILFLSILFLLGAKKFALRATEDVAGLVQQLLSSQRAPLQGKMVLSCRAFFPVSIVVFLLNAPPPPSLYSCLSECWRRSHFYHSSFLAACKGTADEPCNYDNVCRWSRRVNGGDVFKLDSLIIPGLAGERFWFMLCVHFPTRTIWNYDSLGGHNTEEIMLVLRYLEYEWPWYGGPFQRQDWAMRSVPLCVGEFDNRNSGVLALHAAEIASRAEPGRFEAQAVSPLEAGVMRHRLAVVITNGSLD